MNSRLSFQLTTAIISLYVAFISFYNWKNSSRASCAQLSDSHMEERVHGLRTYMVIGALSVSQRMIVFHLDRCDSLRPSCTYILIPHPCELTKESISSAKQYDDGTNSERI